MEVLDFIKNNIGELLKFRNVECIRYGISKWTGAHIIEITPSEVFSSDEFLNIETSLSDKFEELFPKQELIFISNDDIISLGETLFCISRKITTIKIDLEYSDKIVPNFTLEELKQHSYFYNDDSDRYQSAA
jgi:hypothetical protein